MKTCEDCGAILERKDYEGRTMFEARRFCNNQCGRSRGERNSASKLTDDAVREIRITRNSGQKLQEIAIKHGISVTQVSLVVNRKRWKHVV